MHWNDVAFPSPHSWHVKSLEGSWWGQGKRVLFSIQQLYVFSYNGTRVFPCYPVRLITSWLRNSLIIFWGRNPLMRYLSPGEDSHKGHKAIQRWFSVSDCLPPPRILPKEGFGARAHLPRISSHLAALPLLWLQAGCGHIQVNTRILCGTGSGNPLQTEWWPKSCLVHWR